MKFIILIPAQEKNKYSPNGDLVDWGSSSLLEWKISQAKKVNLCKNIYVFSSGKKIKDICHEQGVKFISRENSIKNVNQLHLSVARKFKNDYIIWLNPTYPFIKPKLIDECISIFKKKKNKYDSLVGSYELKEYLFSGKRSLNFNVDLKSESRDKVKKVNQIINAISIIKGSKILSSKNLFGKNVLFKKVDWLSTLEIKNLKDINLFEKLIDSYFE